MEHPFDLPTPPPVCQTDSPAGPISRRRALAAALAGVGGLAAGTTAAPAQEATTKRLGEEGGPEATTLAVGEEGGRPTTLAVGEEGAGPDPGGALREASARIAELLRNGDLPAAYEIYATAKTRAAERGLLGLLSTTSTQIEAVADYEVGRAIRILAGEPGNRDAARDILLGIARMDRLDASRRARSQVPARPR